MQQLKPMVQIPPTLLRVILTIKKLLKIQNYSLQISSLLSIHNGFSVSPENEKLFREILADDEISMKEVKNLTYEQAKALNEFQKISMNLDISTYIPVYKYEEGCFRYFIGYHHNV